MVTILSKKNKIRERLIYLEKREYFHRKLWSKLNLKPPFPQLEKFINAWYNGAQYMLLDCGRRSAKSITSATFLATEANFGPTGARAKRHLMHTGPETDETSKIGEFLWKWLVEEKAIGNSPQKRGTSETNRTIEYPYKTIIRGKTTKSETGREPKHLQGGYQYGIVEDEAASDSQIVYPQYLLPMIGEVSGWIVRPSTPKGLLNHFYGDYCDWKERMESGDPRYYVGHWTSYDNPYIDHAWIEDFRQYCERAGQMELWYQEVMADFTSLSGGVYKKFRASKGDQPWHVGDYPYIPGLPVCIGLDWGTDHPFAAEFGQIVEGDRMRVFHEISKRDGDSPDWRDWVCEYLLSIGLKPVDVEMCYCDPSGLAAKKTFERAGFTLFEAYTGDKFPLNKRKEGIIEVNNLISETRFPKLQIDQSCQKLIFGIQSYKWGTSNEPVKKDDDEVDALRYLIMGRLGLTSTREIQFY